MPTHDRSTQLARLVRSIEALDVPDGGVEVVLVDDGSTDATPHVLAALRAASPVAFRVERLDPSRGPAAARNLGWLGTTAPVVAFTDDDCAPEPRWLVAGLAALRSGPGLGIVQGRTEPRGGDPARALPATRTVRAPSPFFEGCNLFVTREALERSGGFDEGIGMGGEDTALGWAVLEAGYRRAFADDAVVVHETTFPGIGWHLRQARLEANLVTLVRRHPELRDHLWRRWAFRDRTPPTWLAALGILVALGARPGRWRPGGGLVLVVPWLWVNRPLRLHPGWAKVKLQEAAVDVVRALAMAFRSARERTFLL